MIIRRPLPSRNQYLSSHVLSVLQGGNCGLDEIDARQLLRLAISGRDLSIVQLVLPHITLSANFDVRILVAAVQSGDLDIVKAIDEAYPCPALGSLRFLIDDACFNGHDDIALYLYNQYSSFPDIHFEALNSAIDKTRINVVKALLGYDSKGNRVPGWVMPMDTIPHQDALFHSAVNAGSREIIDILDECGLLNMDMNRGVPLTLAAAGGLLEYLEQAIAEGNYDADDIAEARDNAVAFGTGEAIKMMLDVEKTTEKQNTQIIVDLLSFDRVDALKEAWDALGGDLLCQDIH
jgi:hypothetical protein